MTAADFLDLCVDFALVLIAISYALLVVRLVIGPSLADRILALDLVTTLGVGFIGVIGVKTGFYLYVDVAIAVGLVGFLATVALARFYSVRREGDDEQTGLEETR
ncbi:monovalent cation/H+ antiporter complex subunit F [Faunimonas sp. B44]|uniref:monovalent cation/H+ antiporter complex subunit F n=1 Tax=Faunimonas sp. B44 TaxID=3461493 RepID=UPI0040446ACE